MAQIFAGTTGGGAVVALWYHFAIMFEALFILSTLDAGTRVARFMLQDLLANLWRPLSGSGSYANILASSTVVVAAWGYFLYFGAVDPLGGINSLWPLFGISNQLLAAVALVVATTILLKMKRIRWIWLTLIPMSWLVIITMTASYRKIFDPNPRLGFLSYASALAAQIAAGKFPAAKIADTHSVIFNQRLAAAGPRGTLPSPGGARSPLLPGARHPGPPHHHRHEQTHPTGAGGDAHRSHLSRVSYRPPGQPGCVHPGKPLTTLLPPLVVSGAVLARRARFRFPLSNRASRSPALGSPMVFFAWLRCLRISDGAPQSVQSELPEKLASPHFEITRP